MAASPLPQMKCVIILLIIDWLEQRLQSWHLTGESQHWDGLRTSGLLLPTIE
jgi:hypothetical protein